MKYWNWSVAIFAVVCLLGFAARQAIGQIYSSGQAIDLLNSLSKSGLYLGSGSATASATVLALMLTLIGLVRRSDKDFDEGIYKSVNRIAMLATASLMASLLLLLAMVFPVGEFEGLPPSWYSWLYEGLFATTVITVGLLAATVVMLYQTIRQVIAGLTPGDDVSVGRQFRTAAMVDSRLFRVKPDEGGEGFYASGIFSN